MHIEKDLQGYNLPSCPRWIGKLVETDHVPVVSINNNKI